MKRFLWLLVMSVCVVSSWAEDINAMMLHLASGKQVVCLLDEKPVVTFRGEELALTTHMNEVCYQSTDVLKFTYLYVDPDGIGRIEASQCMITLQGKTLKAIGLEADSKISVYSVDGILITSAEADKKGSANIALPEQKGKVYVVKTSVANFKITRP